jgi:G patch domain-containing protein 1
LIAGDFLESLGKELGLKVPQDLDRTQKGKDVPLVPKELKILGEGETSAGNDQKTFEWNPNPKSRMYSFVSSSIKNEEKEVDAYGIGETQVSKDSGFKEENKIRHESGKSDYLGKSSTSDALNNSSSDYDRGKDNIVERKRKREPTQERRKSHSKRHHKREHRSRDDYTRKKVILITLVMMSLPVFQFLFLAFAPSH